MALLGKRSFSEVDAGLKKRFRILYKALLDYTDETGRSLISMFMEKPSRREYPDYYQVIKNPIDMKTIDANIKADKYDREQDLLADFKLMFSNCRTYNEDESLIYQDAVTLEKVLEDKLREMGGYTPRPKRSRGRPSAAMIERQQKLFDAVRDHKDAKGRPVAAMFVKLPSRADYPDYYEVIKKPIDLEKIQGRIRNGWYETLEDLLADLVLMFDNACKYNEPDSQIYKDALTLQQVSLKAKMELGPDEVDGIPNVRSQVQDLLTHLFISVYTHHDEDGRCFSDSINELTEADAKAFTSGAEKPLTFDAIKKNLDRGRYQRLDRFQQDMFEVFEKARQCSRTDSQAFEDSIELQTYFIKLRDELCKNGEFFQSPALRFTEADLNASVDTLRSEKMPKEQQADVDVEMEEKQEAEAKEVAELNALTEDNGTITNTVVINGMEVKVGEFVYIEPREKNMEPHILHVEKFWKDTSGETIIYGCWFYRPEETFHMRSKKFLEKEVFKTDSFSNSPLNQVLGKCCVLFVKEYFKYKPKGFEEKDVYVCESRYFSRSKNFKKMKVWPYEDTQVELELREVPLAMNRVESVFKDHSGIQNEPADDILGGFDEEDSILYPPRPNVVCATPEGAPPDDGAVTYYQQYTMPSGSFKVGDCVYVRTDQGCNLICKIDRLWVGKDGNPYFHGPWFVQTSELPPGLNKPFYPKEVFLSSIEDTNPLLSVCDHCFVMNYKDYVTKRPTEIAEEHVFVCEYKFLEHDKKFAKLVKGLPKCTIFYPGVMENEFICFKKPLLIQRPDPDPETMLSGTPKKEGMAFASHAPMPFLQQGVDMESNEESLDQPPILMPELGDQSNMSFDSFSTSQGAHITSHRKFNKRIVTGYIIYASESRKSVCEANPNLGFGEISRIIGQAWKELPREKKAEFEERAKIQNAQALKDFENAPESPAPVVEKVVVEHPAYICQWENNCDFQFEDSADLFDHLGADPTGHVWRSFEHLLDKENGEYQCRWHNCGRVKKGATPFPSLLRLVQHCKQVHVNKQQPRSIPPERRSRNFVPSRHRVASPNSSSTSASNPPFLQPNQPLAAGPPPIINGQPISAPTIISNQNNTSLNTIQQPYAQPLAQPVTAIAQAPNNSTPMIVPGAGIQPKPLEPLFVAPPIQTGRLLHTSTYIKYIESLKPEARSISNWEKQLHATAETALPPDPKQLPVHWIKNGPGNHGTIVNALWALRDHMMKDALKLHQLAPSQPAPPTQPDQP